MNTKLLLAFATLCALSGCASSSEKMWYRDGALEADFTREQGQCQAQAYAGQNVALVYQACMRGKGWTLR